MICLGPTMGSHGPEGPEGLGALEGRAPEDKKKIDVFYRLRAEEMFLENILDLVFFLTNT